MVTLNVSEDPSFTLPDAGLIEYVELATEFIFEPVKTRLVHPDPV